MKLTKTEVCSFGLFVWVRECEIFQTNDKFIFIELKANSKAVPEREGGKRSLTEGF